MKTVFKKIIPLLFTIITLTSCSRIKSNPSSPKVDPSSPVNPISPVTPVDPIDPSKKRVAPEKFFKYRQYGNSITVSGINEQYKNREEIYIPEKIKNRFVTSISRCALNNNSKVKKITLPNTLVTIGAATFRSCKNLEEINIPASLQSFDKEALSLCSKLKTIKVSEDNKYFKSVDNFLLSKDGKTLYRAPAREDIKIPEGVRFINDCSFTGLNIIKKIYFPSTFYQNSDSFYGCNNIEEIKISKDNKNFVDYGYNGLFNKSCYFTYPEYLYLACKNTYIPSTITYFSPNSFSAINDFSNIKNNSKKYIIKDNCVLTSDESELIFGNSKSKIPNTVTNLSSYSFAFRSDIQNLDLSYANFKIISSAAFESCLNLEKIELNDKVEKIEDYAFADCFVLKEFTFPKNVKTINPSFIHCFSLKKIKIESQYIDIDVEASNPLSYSPLEKIEANFSKDSPVQLENDSLVLNKKILLTATKNTIIGENINEIAKEAFGGLGIKNNLYIPKNVTTIGEPFNAGFSRIKNIKSDSEEYFVEDGCLIRKKDMTVLTSQDGTSEIPEGVLAIGDSAFIYSKIKSIKFPNSLTKIGTSAFKYCVFLDDVRFSKSIGSIESYAFHYCPSLRDIYFEDNIQTVKSYFKERNFFLYFPETLQRATIDNKVYYSLAEILN